MGGQSLVKVFDGLVMSVLNTFSVTCLTDCPPFLICLMSTYNIHS